MSERFKDLKKVSKDPYKRMLALANAKLATPVSLPASASVEAVLEGLDKLDAYVDMIRLLAIALPPRERVWWGCLAAKDVVGSGPEDIPRPLGLAEKWVFTPSDDAREKARLSVETADIDDETTLCAVAVAMCDGKLGAGELAQFDAPPGGAASAIFGMNMISLGKAAPEDADAHCALLIDRALDIARGGSGRFEPNSTDTEGQTT